MDEMESPPDVDLAVDGEGAVPPGPPPAPPWSPWCDLPPNSRPHAERTLMNWVELVFRSGWPEPSEAVKPCWPHHADAVATLRGLKARLDAIYSPAVEGPEIGPAPLYRMLDWDLDLERAQGQWKDSFRRCDRTCCRAAPPSYADPAREAAATDQAAEGAWGQVPPDLPPPMEPWEVAKGIAERQAKAATTEGEAPEGDAGQSISEGAESW